MTRPIYETAGDLARESDVRARIALWAKCDVHKTPDLSAIDCIMSRDGRAVAMAEIKCRTNAMDQYPTYMISNDKLERLWQLHADIKLPVYLFVRWSCGRIGMLDLTNTQPDSVTVGGRTDRKDPNDTEVVALYAMKKFQVLPCE